jgi:hypothetical protein
MQYYPLFIPDEGSPIVRSIMPHSMSDIVYNLIISYFKIFTKNLY